MFLIRAMLLILLVTMPARLAMAQDEGYDGQMIDEGLSVGEGDPAVGGPDVGGEAVGEGEQPVGGPDVTGEAIGEEDQPIGGEPLY